VIRLVIVPMTVLKRTAVLDVPMTVFVLGGVSVFAFVCHRLCCLHSRSIQRPDRGLRAAVVAGQSYSPSLAAVIANCACLTPLMAVRASANRRTSAEGPRSAISSRQLS